MVYLVLSLFSFLISKIYKKNMYCWESLDPKTDVWVAYPDDLQAVIEAALLRKHDDDAILKI